MFWTYEDIQPAVESARKLFGPENQYVSDTPYKNVSIMTREYGKLWFGDLESTKDIQERLEMLSVTINQKVYVTLDYEHDISIFETKSKLRDNSTQEN